jgi:HAMP domain-containing protein
MSSNINATDLDITFPIAGQDNDTQGFRTNFTVIKNNFNVAATEITALQANVASTITNVNAPLSHSAAGIPGQIAFDTSYFYVCVATNTWLRANLSTF